jgi:hypothetical protein
VLYQLPNGKVIEISTEQFVEMTDEELEYLIAYNYGEVQENPWFGSVLSKQSFCIDDDCFNELPPELTDVKDEDKIDFLDADIDKED